MVKKENIALKTLTRVTQITEILDKEISNYTNLLYISKVIIMYWKENALNIKTLMTELRKSLGDSNNHIVARLVR